MPQENDLLVQRRANMEALAALGVDLYPHEFERTDTVTQLVAAHGAKTKAELEAVRIETRTSGRILAIRSFGKANFLVLSDGRARIQVYLRADSMPERDFTIFTLLDLGDFVGVSGHLFRTRTDEFTIWAALAHVPREVSHPASREVARPAGHRDPVPPALPRSDRDSRDRPRLRGAKPGAGGGARVPQRARTISKSRRR